MKNSYQKVTSASLKGRGIKDSDGVFFNLDNIVNIIELDLSDNQLTCLPTDLSHCINLASLDLSNNPFQNFEAVAGALATLPNLKELKINLSTQEHVFTVLSSLPNLEYLNAKSTKEETHGIDIDEKEIEAISLNNEIPNFNNLFQRITAKLKLYKENTERFSSEFQNILKDQVTKINRSVDNSIPNYIYATNILTSKIEIFSFFQDRAISMLERHNDMDLLAILKDTNAFIKHQQLSISDIIKNIEPKIEEKVESYKKLCNDLSKESKNANSSLQALEQKYNHISKENEKYVQKYEHDTKAMQEKIAALERENALMTEQLLKKAKEIISESQNDESCVQVQNKNRNLVVSRSGVSLSDSQAIQKTKSSVGNSVLIGPVTNRVLTKKMLLEIIDEIYASKASFDKKCTESKMPRETLEQHLYTYLNQKYGLKNLIIEWATSIINGIRIFSQEDSEVCLFGKILRNELEEESVLILHKLKSTITDLLSYYLQSKNSLKSQGDIEDMVRSKQNGYLNEDEWKTIVQYLFVNEERSIIEQKIYEFVKRIFNEAHKQEGKNKKLTREEMQILSKVKEDNKIAYSDFVKIILDFQIRLRDKYLKNFITLFRKVDQDTNGIINEEEFVHLISISNLYPKNKLNENLDRLLYLIDPYNNKQMTFSEVVNLLAQEMITNHGEEGKMMALDKISMEDGLFR